MAKTCATSEVPYAGCRTVTIFYDVVEWEAGGEKGEGCGRRARYDQSERAFEETRIDCPFDGGCAREP